MVVTHAPLVAVAILFAGACEFPVRAPSQPVNPPDYFSKKMQCLEVGLKKWDRELLEEKQAATDPETRYLLFNPEFCYSPNLNTCIYSGGFASNSYEEFTVTDALTNRELAALRQPQRRNTDEEELQWGKKRDQWRKKREHLFGGCAR